MIQTTPHLPTSPHADRLGGLLDRFPQQERSKPRRRISSGSAALDRLLPDGGFRAGSLVEWLSERQGSGVSLLALQTVRELHCRGETVAVVDRQRKFYPPAAAALGVELANTIVVRPSNHADELWAIDQTLRSSHIAAVFAWPDEIDSFAFRRLQLAAEESGALGLLIRPAAARREPTWAHVRLAATPQPSLPKQGWRWQVQLLRCRGGFGQGEVCLQLDEQTGAVYETPHETHAGNLAAKLACAAVIEQTA